MVKASATAVGAGHFPFIFIVLFALIFISVVFGFVFASDIPLSIKVGCRCYDIAGVAGIFTCFTLAGSATYSASSGCIGLTVVTWDNSAISGGNYISIPITERTLTFLPEAHFALSRAITVGALTITNALLRAVGVFIYDNKTAISEFFTPSFDI